jgi:CBS domain containing-hemolysin-like protein
MVLFALALLLLGLGLWGIALRKTYEVMPARELKRQARAGDQLAGVLYRAAAYGPSLKLLLWVWIGLTTAGGFILLSMIAPAPLVFVAVAGLIWYGFAWMPSSRVSRFGSTLAVTATPFVAWVLNYAHPLLARLSGFVSSRKPVTFHTGLFEREDLIELLEAQRAQPDSRISSDELNLVVHALSFGEILVQEVMIPRRAVAMVPETDVVGPILMGELHKTGHSRFPVYGEEKDQITGTLHLRKILAAKEGGSVKNIMKPSVYYVHEDANLYQVLHAFITTKNHLFVVVNDFEEFVGIITIEDVIEQVIGRKIDDEFDTYDDVRAVAKSLATAEHKSRKTVPETISEVVE